MLRGNNADARKGSIPIIDIDEEIVDSFGRPTPVMTLFFHAIIKSLLRTVDEAPIDGKKYARKDGGWVEII